MNNIATQFAPAERADRKQLDGQSRHFLQFNLLRQVLDAMPNGVVILNQQRQIVYVNQPFLNFVGLADREEALGLRPGEAVGCQYASQTDGGCGTTEFCRTCGAVQAILQAQKGTPDVRECRITRLVDGKFDALDLRVKATPLVEAGETFTIFTVIDIADEKRRQVLERIFFHDLQNTAGVIYGVAETIHGNDEADAIGQLLVHSSRKLVDEINGQQQLLAAENGRLSLHTKPIPSLTLLEETIALYRPQADLRRCRLQLDPNAVDHTLLTDPTVLGRVLSNMVKNALEASKSGDAVTLGCDRLADAIRFWVHNPAYIPPRVQRQIFQRSFSTKGARRGLGAYSMRLLSERYLQGRVDFETSPANGTTFRATYPFSVPGGEAKSV